MGIGTCDTLTEREREVLRRLAEGESNRQIAKSLAITPATARTHTQNVLMKLGVQSRVQAAAAASALRALALSDEITLLDGAAILDGALMDGAIMDGALGATLPDGAPFRDGDAALDGAVRHVSGGYREDPLSALTRREREVLSWMAQGATRAAIAARLHLSPHTVRTHVRNILAKLDVHSTPEAVALFRKRQRVLGGARLTRPG